MVMSATSPVASESPAAVVPEIVSVVLAWTYVVGEAVTLAG